MSASSMVMSSTVVTLSSNSVVPFPSSVRLSMAFVAPIIELKRVVPLDVIVKLELVTKPSSSTIEVNKTFPLPDEIKTLSVSVTSFVKVTASSVVMMSAHSETSPPPDCINSPSSMKLALLAISSSPLLLMVTVPSPVVVTVSSPVESPKVNSLPVKSIPPS